MIKRLRTGRAPIGANERKMADWNNEALFRNGGAGIGCVSGKWW